MKNLNIKILSYILAIVLIVPFCFVTAKADNGSNYIGEDTKNNVNVVVSYNSEKVSVAWYTTQVWKYTVSINYNCIANTTTRVYHAGLSNNAHLLSYNCTIENVASNYIEIKTVNQSYAELEIYETDPITFSMVIGLPSATKIADGTNSQLKTITDTYLNPMNTSLSSLLTSVNQIKGYVDQLEGYVDGIEGHIDDVETYLSSIESYQMNIDNTLGNIDIAVEFMEGKLTSLDSNVSSLLTEFRSQTSLLNTLNSKINTLNITLENIYNDVHNIDNLIDTISWSKYDDYLGINLDGNLFGTVSKLTNNNQNAYIVFGTNNLAGNFDKLFKITINGQFTYTTEDKIKVYLQDQNYSLTELDSKYILYKYISRGTINVYIDVKFPITNYSNTRIAVFIKDGAIVNPYAYNQIDMINNNDIEYWKLLSYFEDYKFHTSDITIKNTMKSILEDIRSAIGNIQITVTNEEVQNTTNNFDNSINTVNNIHNIYNDQFNNVKNNINNYDFSINSDLTSSSVGINDLFTRFYSLDFFRIPILVIMACAIFLIVLG